MQLMIVGDPGCGKHTLSSRLQDKRIKQQFHEGIHISEWECRPGGANKDFQFRTWIFSSLDDYTATHQCFLHQSSLYLLLFNLKHGNEGVHELKSWLNSITQLAPRSGVIIVGTHSDEVPQHDVDLLLQQAEMVAAAYGRKLKTTALVSVDLKHTPGNVSSVQETILQYAVNYPVLQEGKCQVLVAAIMERGRGRERKSHVCA
jgi:leucine-rich repeat kinase 1/leucine-rich repeat kinase 2